MKTESHPSKFFAYLAVLVGGLLFLSGLAAFFGYLGLPIVAFGDDLLGPQLGQMAAMFLGLVCGALAVYHGGMSILNRPSRPLKLPPIYFFWIIFAVVLGLGNVLLNFHVAEEFLFPPVFLLGAALPTVAVVAWVSRRLNSPITWRQALLALVAGSTLSIFVAIVLETFLPFVAYLLIGPLEYLAYSFADVFSGGDPFSRLFLSPLVIFFLITTALAAPIPEEFAKALCLPLFGRERITDERRALMIGLASGAGFAILENMLYEGLYAQWNGWSWGGVTLLRGFGAILHTLGTGLVALGWFRMREHGVGQLLKAYALAVGLHTLWNGGFEAFVYITGIDYYGGLGPAVNFYGIAIEALLVVYLVGLSLGLWWMLRWIVNGLSRESEPDAVPASPAFGISSRMLAGWAFASALVIVPIGAALNGIWSQLLALALAGR